VLERLQSLRAGLLDSFGLLDQHVALTGFDINLGLLLVDLRFPRLKLLLLLFDLVMKYLRLVLGRMRARSIRNRKDPTFETVTDALRYLFFLLEFFFKFICFLLLALHLCCILLNGTKCVVASILVLRKSN
jgi:hypothetical protein